MKSGFIICFAALFATACGNTIDGANDTKATLPPATTPTTFTDTAKTITVPQQTITTAAPTPVKTAALNPAHGQPGHRCDLAVGAPLTGSAPATSNPGASKPVTITNNTPVQQPTLTSQPVQNPTLVTPPGLPLNNAQSGVRLNPAHGQPGHDCNVEVGKPLKQ